MHGDRQKRRLDAKNARATEKYNAQGVAYAHGIDPRASQMAMVSQLGGDLIKGATAVVGLGGVTDIVKGKQALTGKGMDLLNKQPVKDADGNPIIDPTTGLPVTAPPPPKDDKKDNITMLVELGIVGFLLYLLFGKKGR